MLIIWTTHREVWFRTLNTSQGGQNGPQCSCKKNSLKCSNMAQNGQNFSKITQNDPKIPKMSKKMFKLINWGGFG